MKKIIRILAFALVLLQIVPALVSCNGTKDPAGTTTGNDVTTPEETTEVVAGTNGTSILENGQLKYTVIKYVAEPDSVTFDAVKRLRDKIREYTGTAPSIKPDYSSEERPADPNAFEILVGETNYAESKQVLADLNYGDYKITTVGNKIVIAAFSSDEISRAINYITGTMFKDKDAQGNRTMVITDYEFHAKRYINEVTINGVDLKEYSIVYGTVGSDDDYNLTNAKIIREAFSGKAGYLIPLIKDTDECKTARKIYVGTKFNKLPASVQVPVVDALKYTFKTVGQDFFIMGGGLLSNQIAVQEFVSRFFYKRPDDGKVNIVDVDGDFLNVKECPKTAGTEFRVMTYNIMAQWSGWGGDYMPVVQRFEAFKAVMDIYDPDVVGLQEVSEHWSNQILDEYGSEYAYIYQKTPDGKYINLSTIIYKKDKFDVIDKGLQYFSFNGPNQIRLVTWVILKDKATGKQFAFFNTHWKFQESDGTNAERESHSIENAVIINKVMADHPDVKYAFSTADYNTVLTHQYCINFLKSANLVNSLDIAKAAGTLKNEVGGCGSLGVSRINNTGGGSIDNIFVTNNMKVLRHETILWNLVEHVSDHSPKYADIVLGD